MLAKLKRGKADAKAKDKAAMTGMFSKGELYDAKSLKESEERRNAERRLAENGGKPGPRTLEDCEAEAKEGDAAVTHLRSRGQDADADALEAKVAAHRAQLEAHKRKAADGSFRPDEIDFSNPTEEQVPTPSPGGPTRTDSHARPPPGSRADCGRQGAWRRPVRPFGATGADAAAEAAGPWR